jgi:cytochrome c oxidase subunit II
VEIIDLVLAPLEEAMKKLGAVLGAVMLAAVSVSNSMAQALQPSTSEFELTAAKYDFTPNVIKVKQGDHVKLVITARDREHGFKLGAFHVDRRLPKGEAVTVEFTADQTGTFPFQCSVFCGLGHKKMTGQLIVE